MGADPTLLDRSARGVQIAALKKPAEKEHPMAPQPALIVRKGRRQNDATPITRRRGG
jgi:hypothetical protein